MPPPERSPSQPAIDAPLDDDQPNPLPLAPSPPPLPIAPPPDLPSQAPRRSTRRGASKPPGFYAQLHSGDSVADNSACHLRATECSRLYGQKPTKAAGITEVVNMIRVRQAALPQDFRNLSPRAIREALPSFLFYKAKDALPDSSSPPPLIPDPSPPAPTGSSSSWTLVQSSRGRRRCAPACASDITLRGRWVGGGGT